MSDPKPGDIDPTTGGVYFVDPVTNLMRIDISDGVKWQPGEREAYRASMDGLAAALAAMTQDEKKAALRAELDLAVKILAIVLPAAAVAFPPVAPFTPMALAGVQAIVKAIES